VAALATALHYRYDLQWGIQAAAGAVPWVTIIDYAVLAVLSISAAVVLLVIVGYTVRLVLAFVGCRCFCGAGPGELCRSRGDRHRLPHHNRSYGL